MKLLKKINPVPMLLIIAVLFMALATPCLYARDSNGVTVTDFTLGASYGLHIDHFTAFNPASATYIYNEAGGATATSGEVSLLGHFGSKTIIISVPTLGSTSIDFRLEGQVGTTMSTWANVRTVNVAAATTIDLIFDIPEYITAYRLGVKVNTNGTDVINVSTSAINSR